MTCLGTLIYLIDLKFGLNKSKVWASRNNLFLLITFSYESLIIFGWENVTLKDKNQIPLSHCLFLLLFVMRVV